MKPLRYGGVFVCVKLIQVLAHISIVLPRILLPSQSFLPSFERNYLNKKSKGIYNCVCCDNELFSSDTKFDSKSGWPSFYDVINNENISHIKDSSHGMNRIEVLCSNCDAHLGHVFDDGPQPTGQRYCINSLSLKLEEIE